MKLTLATLPTTALDHRIEAYRTFRSAAIQRGLADCLAEDTALRDALRTTEEVTAKAVSDLLVAAAVAERTFQSKVAAEAVSDLLKAAREASIADLSPVVILTATLLDRKSQTYNVSTDTGEIIVSATDHPLADGAATIVTTRELPENARVALFYTGKTYPAFGPMNIHAAAALGIIRKLSKKYALKARKKAKT